VNDLLKAADYYEGLGEYAEARDLYLAYERQHPFDASGKLLLARVLMRMAHWDAAIIRLQEVRNSGVFVEEALYLLAQCFQHNGLIYAARELYTELARCNAGYKDVQARLQALTTPEVVALTTIVSASAMSQHSPNAPPDLAFGSVDAAAVTDRYVLQEEIGRGGMGVVYKALQKPTDRVVAIKLLPPYLASEEMHRIRFFREAEIVNKFNHPHIVTVLETNLPENFLVMEYVPGGNLTAWAAQHPARRDGMVRLVVQILDALHTVHEHGIIHRDLKPDNILLVDDRTAKLTDFGIAHICGATITHTGMHLGTLPYMSPEQIQGIEIDRRSDVYAIGVLLYRLLTGALPFTGRDTSYHHIHTPPWPPRKLAPTLSPQLEAIILTCLAKRPADRFADARTLQHALLQADVSPGRAVIAA
jgi:predicted Ser/Thr protein kinase